MFHKPRWLAPGGRFHEVWLLAHGRDIDYEGSERVDLRDVCHDFEEAVTSDSGAPNHRVSLRLLSQLCAGIVKLYSLKLDIFSDDMFKINARHHIEQFQIISGNSSSLISDYLKRSDSDSLEFESESEIESKSNLSGTNPTTLEKHNKSLFSKAVAEGIGSSRRLINTASAGTEAIKRTTTQIAVAEPSPSAIQSNLKDSVVFKKPKPPIVEEVELGLPQSIQTESGIGLSLDLPILSSQDEGTERISQLNKGGKKGQQINLDQELKNYESSQLIRTMARGNQPAGPSEIDLRLTDGSPKHLKSLFSKRKNQKITLPGNRSSHFQSDDVAVSDAGPLEIISRKSSPTYIESQSFLSKQPTYVLHQGLDSEDAEDINYEFGTSAPENVDIRASKRKKTSRDVGAKEKTKDIYKDRLEVSRSMTPLSESVSDMEYMPERACRSLEGTGRIQGIRSVLEAYDDMNIRKLELQRDVRFSSPVYNAKKRKVHSQSELVELEVVRKQRRLSRSSQEYESLHPSLDKSETLLLPRTDPVYMEIIPRLSKDNLNLSSSAVPLTLQRNPAVIPLTLGDLEDLEPIEETCLPAFQRGKKTKTVLLKRTYTAPSVASYADNLRRRRVLLGMSHSDNVCRRLQQLYDRNMITLPCELDQEMLQHPVSSTPIHVTEAFASKAFVPADVSFIAEAPPEPRLSKIGSEGESCEGSESEEESHNNLTLPTTQNKTVSPSPKTPILDTAIIVGRERYWLRSDEAKKNRQVQQSQPNVNVNEAVGRRPISMPVPNVRAPKTKSLPKKKKKDFKRRLSCPTPKSQKLVMSGITKLKTFVCGITSVSPKIPNLNSNNSLFMELGNSGNIRPIQTRGSEASSRESDDKSNSVIAGPSRSHPSRSHPSKSELLHHQKLTFSNSSKTCSKTVRRLENRLENSDNRIALIVICPENTINVENSGEIKVAVTPVRQVGKGIKELYRWESRNV